MVSFQYYFKFQSDSINTSKSRPWRIASLSFKFQSDSINTTDMSKTFKQKESLNSNLILLILLKSGMAFRQYHTLNSNLILLIRWQKN